MTIHWFLILSLIVPNGAQVVTQVAYPGEAVCARAALQLSQNAPAGYIWQCEGRMK